MRIAWFTPFNVESAIGRYSKFAVEALNKYIEVDLFTPSDQNLHETKCKVICFTQDNVDKCLLNYDLAVYNMGDNSIYHSVIYTVAQRHQGVMIVHDVSLHNFMRGYCLVYKNSERQFELRLKNEFGIKNAQILCEAALSQDKFKKLNFLKYNFSKHIADDAFGVIVHSLYHESYMKQYFKGSIAVIKLLNMNDKLDELDNSVKFDSYETNKLHILTVGNLNENKRIDSIIRVLGENPELAKSFDYTIIGSKDNAHYCDGLEKIINAYDLKGVVNLVGVVSHKELAYYYKDANIVSNLRYPAYEGASASIVEQMAIGKCCMVSDTGAYAEIDDKCVIKISPNNEMIEIQTTLKAIQQGNVDTREIGENARNYAERVFDRDLYAQQVYRFLKTIIFQRPIHVVKDKISSVIEEMPTVINIYLEKKVAQEITELYGATSFEEGNLQ